MKKAILPILLLLIVNYISAQTTTGRINGIKDAWGETINYIGEIKNRQPNGLGIAIYNNDHALRYSGYFLNGMYNGKGAIVFKDGSFLSGEWKNGKLNGQGSYLNKDGDLFIGTFIDGKKEGKGIFIYKDNSILQGELKADKYHGRCIYIPKDPTAIYDNIYRSDEKNGLGYQYELDTKKLFEGSWKDGKWENATTGNYYSFLKAANFTGEKTDNQILMGSVNQSTKFLTDTAFFYDLKKKKRYFGHYKNGFLDNGIIVRDDSSRFVGSLNDIGATGYGYSFKVKNYFDEGNYINDYLSGSNCMSIDLIDKTIYYGEVADKGSFTGKAWFANKYNDLYSGDYKKGKFTGSGFKITAEGYCMRGTWNNGNPISIASVTDDKGLPVSLAPKTLNEAIATVAKQSKSYLYILKGAEDYSNLNDTLSYALRYNSIMNFPVALKKDYVIEDDDFYTSYVTTYLETFDFEKARLRYIDLCKQLNTAKIMLNRSDLPFSLTGTPNEPEKYLSNNSCIFTFPNKDDISTDFVAAVVMVKDKSDKYSVEIVLGDLHSLLLSGD